MIIAILRDHPTRASVLFPENPGCDVARRFCSYLHAWKESTILGRWDGLEKKECVLHVSPHPGQTLESGPEKRDPCGACLER
jgi:hypothetical protein